MELRVLLTDDDADDRELFTEAMTATDPAVAVDYAVNGEHTLTKLKENKKPDLIFLDINMPVMSGWECLKEIKKNDDTSDIPVIIYSTSSHPRDQKIAKDLGALCLFTKPTDYPDLKKMLSKIITLTRN